MSLSCYCDDDYEWYYEPNGYSMLRTKCSRKCCSCREKIAVGATVCEMTCWRPPQDGIQVRIYGEEGQVPMASKWLCERCADLFWSLHELGFCVTLGDDMRELVKEYAAMQWVKR